MLEIAGIVVFLSGCLYLGVRFARELWDAPGAVAFVLCAAGGYLLSDLLSGLVHWIGDTIGDEQTPVIGRHFVTPFRMHHVDPKDITRHDFIETNGNNSIVSVPVLVGVWAVLPEERGWLYYTCVVVAWSAFFVFCTNQFHKWAHADKAPRLARVFQRWGLILRPSHHDIHHAAPHDKYYCITVGWLNPVLAKVRLFRALEWLVGLVRPSLLHIAERERVQSSPPGT
jgi:plasmanylethanolamine desaturase